MGADTQQADALLLQQGLNLMLCLLWTFRQKMNPFSE